MVEWRVAWEAVGGVRYKGAALRFRKGAPVMSWRYDDINGLENMAGILWKPGFDNDDADWSGRHGLYEYVA